MNPQVHHDPLIKRQIKDAIHAHLYEPVGKDFAKRLEALIYQNCLKMKYGHKSFSFKGITYTIDSSPAPRMANRLAPEYVPDMKAYLADLHQVNRQEMPYVMGFIDQVLNSSNHLEDYLVLFPESLHRIIQDFIDACPCRNHALTGAQIREIRDRNNKSIQLLKERLTTNLLL